MDVFILSFMGFLFSQSVFLDYLGVGAKAENRAKVSEEIVFRSESGGCPLLAEPGMAPILGEVVSRSAQAPLGL